MVYVPTERGFFKTIAQLEGVSDGLGNEKRLELLLREEAG